MKNERQSHHKFKLFIQSKNPYAQTEVYFPQIKRYADVVIYGQKNFILEYQRSAISHQELKKRHVQYLSQTYIPLWIIPKTHCRFYKRTVKISKSNRKFVTDILSNTPCLYLYDYHRNNFLVLFNFLAIGGNYFYYDFKTITVEQILSYQTLPQPKSKNIYCFSRKSHFTNKEVDLIVSRQLTFDEIKRYHYPSYQAFYYDSSLWQVNYCLRHGILLHKLNFPLLASKK